MFGEVYAAALGPVIQRPLHILLRQVEVFRQLPKLAAAAGKSLPEIRFGQILLRCPPVCSILTALHQLIGTADLVERAGGCMPQLMAADPTQQSCGADLGKIQKYSVMLLIPYGGTGLGTAGVGDHIHLMGFAVIVKIRNLKHLSFAFHASAVPYPGRPVFLLHPVP